MTESALAGALLGLFFYAGLWWTVRKGLAAEQPALWFFASLMLRTAVVMGGFLLVAQGQFSRVLACLLGFQLARIGVTRGVHVVPLRGPRVVVDTTCSEFAETNSELPCA